MELELKEVVVGQKYWSILPSCETAKYDNDPPPSVPWQGVLRQGPLGPLYLHSIDPSGNVNTVSWGVALVGSPDRPRSLYATQEDAYTAFMYRSMLHVERCLAVVSARMDMLASVILTNYEERTKNGRPVVSETPGVADTPASAG